MDVIRLVRRHARRPLAPAALRLAASRLDGDTQDAWRAAEQALAAEFGVAPRRAERLVAAFAAVAQASGSAEAAGRAARLRGSYETYLGRYRSALPHYETAAASLRGAARDGARLGLAEALHRLGRHDEAIPLCRAVRRAARRRGDALLASGADLSEGVAEHESGRPGVAVKLYRRARDGFAAAGIARLAATADQNRANALVLLDRYADAEPLYAAAAETFAAQGLAHESARCLYNRGALLGATDRLGEADAVLRDAESRLRRAGDAPTAALARLDRGDVLLRAGLLPEARHALSSARRALGRRVPVGERERARLLLARVELALGNAAAASRLLARAAPAGHGPLEALRSELLGRAAALRGRFGPARAALLEAARRHAAGGRAAARVRALIAAGWCAVSGSDLTAARRSVTAAERAAAGLGLPSLDHAAAALRFLVEDGAGRRPAASSALDRALRKLERVRDGLGPDALRSAVLRGREAWFARAVRHLLAGPDGVSRALALLERWRARALVDLMGAAEQLRGAGPGDEAVVRLRARVAALERRLEARETPAFLRAGNGRDASDAPSARTVARTLRAAERRLADALSRTRTHESRPPPDLDAVRATLPRGTVVLALFADDDGSLLFGLDRGGIDVVSGDATHGDVARLVDDLRFELGQFELGPGFVARHEERLRRRTDALLRDLARHTLAPVADRLRAARNVMIVPHGAWHHVPFAALPIGRGRLAEHAPVALTPALGALRIGGRRARGAPLVLAVADAAAPTIEAEGRRVAGVLSGARLLVGPDASLEALSRRSGGAPATLHVAAHGRYRADAPAMSGVRLADGWLRAADFAHLPLRGSTVVLSGCETGVAAVDAGDEVHGLVRGVLASGAHELVASLWRVDDPCTAELMSRVHAARSRGVPTPAALARAQSALAAEGFHPWHWAGFGVWTRRGDFR